MGRHTRPQTVVTPQGWWRRHHWHLIGHPVVCGRTWTYRGAVWQADRAVKILRQLSVAHAALALRGGS